MNEFDAAMTCILAAIAADSSSPKAIRDSLRKVANPPGEKVTFLDLPRAIKLLRAGKDINYEGIAGPIDWDGNGDPASATYDFYKYVNSTLTPLRQYRNLHGRVLELDLTPPTTPAIAGKRVWTARHVVFRVSSHDPGAAGSSACSADATKLRRSRRMCSNSW